MSYHIEINEYQRRLIMKALTSADVNQFSQAPGSGDAFDTEAIQGLDYREIAEVTGTPPRGHCRCRVPPARPPPCVGT